MYMEIENKKWKEISIFAVHFLIFPVASNHLLCKDFEEELPSFCVKAGKYILQETFLFELSNLTADYNNQNILKGKKS